MLTGWSAQTSGADPAAASAARCRASGWSSVTRAFDNTFAVSVAPILVLLLRRRPYPIERRRWCDCLRGEQAVHDRRLARRKRAFERGGEFGGRRHAFAVPAIGDAERSEVGVGQPGLRHAARIVPLLVHADRAVDAVVDHD